MIKEIKKNREILKFNSILDDCIVIKYKDSISLRCEYISISPGGGHSSFTVYMFNYISNKLTIRYNTLEELIEDGCPLNFDFTKEEITDIIINRVVSEHNINKQDIDVEFYSWERLKMGESFEIYDKHKNYD